MRKILLSAACAALLALGGFALAGCAQPAKEDVNANVPAGAPPLMPVSHEGRYDQLSAPGCYGCHGANSQANPMLATATAMPADHYADGSAETLKIDSVHDQCNTCHVQG